MHWEIAIGNWSIDLFWFVWDSLLILRHVFPECASEFPRALRNQLLRTGWNNAALLCSFRLVLDKGSLCYMKAQVLCNLLTFYMYVSALLDCLHSSCLSQTGEGKLWNPTSDLFRSALCLSVSFSACLSVCLSLTLFFPLSPCLSFKHTHTQWKD